MNLKNQNLHVLRAAVLAHAIPTQTSEETCKLISEHGVNFIFENNLYSLTTVETEAVLNNHLDNPMPCGGSFYSGCSLTRFNEVVNSAPDYPAGKYFLPALETSRSNTIKQAERSLSKMFRERTVNVRNEHAKPSQSYNTFHIHLGSVQEDKSSENLSEQKCTVNVFFDSKTEQIERIEFISESGLDTDNKTKIEEAFDNAQGQINSTQWGNAWRVLNQSFNSIPLVNQTYLCESVLALSVIDYFIDVSVKCGQHVYRADRPQVLVELDLAEQVKKLLDKAKNAKGYKASEVDKLSNVADTIARLKKSLNLASDTLEAQVELVKQEWELVKQRQENKIKESGYVLTEQGQAFLTRKPEQYVILNVDNKDFEILRHQVLSSPDKNNPFIAITEKLFNEPMSVAECVQLFQVDQAYQNAFKVLSDNDFATVTEDLHKRLQSYSNMNMQTDSTLIEYNLIHKTLK